MTWSLAATVIGVLNGIVTFIKSLFGSKSAQQSAGPSVSEVNKSAKQAADIARQTDTETQEAIHDAQVSSAASVAAVRAAPSLQSGGETVADAIRRANADVQGK